MGNWYLETKNFGFLRNLRTGTLLEFLYIPHDSVYDKSVKKHRLAIFDGITKLRLELTDHDDVFELCHAFNSEKSFVKLASFERDVFTYEAIHYDVIEVFEPDNLSVVTFFGKQYQTESRNICNTKVE